MYKNAVDAFESAVSELGASYDMSSGCHLTNLSRPETRLANGVRYCFAELTDMSGTQYGVEAFGDEAEELYHKASSMKENAKGLRMSAPLLVRS